MRITFFTDSRFLAIMLLSTLLGGCKKANVEFIVQVPEGTEQVTITGNLKILGNWDPARLPMMKTAENRFSLKVKIPVGTYIEYKFTRGSWITEALTDDRQIPGNHNFIVTEDTAVVHVINYWRESLLISGSGITGTVEYYRNFYSPQLQNNRDIIVWLPPSYENSTKKRYPVLYLHDGQNVFDSFTSFMGQDWQLDETATSLIEQGKMREIIMVGIENTYDRTAEYSPVHKGKQYSAFLINTVKPLIDSTYRTLPDRKHTAVMGSSMGGIISFHLIWEYPDVFSMAGCLSPAFLVDDNEIMRRVRRTRSTPREIRLAILNGTEDLDAELQHGVDMMMIELRKKGFIEGEDLIYKIVDGATHNEQAWAGQTPDVLLFFFGDSAR